MSQMFDHESVYKNFKGDVCMKCDLEVKTKQREHLMLHEKCPKFMIFCRDMYVCTLCQKCINVCDRCVNEHIRIHNKERAQVFASTCILLTKHERGIMTMDCIQEIAKMVNEKCVASHTCGKQIINLVCKHCHKTSECSLPVCCSPRAGSQLTCDYCGFTDGTTNYIGSTGALHVSGGVGIGGNLTNMPLDNTIRPKCQYGCKYTSFWCYSATCSVCGHSRQFSLDEMRMHNFALYSDRVYINV